MIERPIAVLFVVPDPEVGGCERHWTTSLSPMGQATQSVVFTDDGVLRESVKG